MIVIKHRSYGKSHCDILTPSGIQTVCRAAFLLKIFGTLSVIAKGLQPLCLVCTSPLTTCYPIDAASEITSQL